MCTVMLSKFFKEMYHHFWMGALTVNANSATQRILELAISSGATPEQMQAMQWASGGNYNPREQGGEFNQLKKIWR